MKKIEYIILLKRLGLAFLAFPIVRFVFLLTNLDYFSGIGVSELAKAFFYGMRFDFSTLLIVNAIFIIFSVIPIRVKAYNILLKLLFILFNSLALIINVIDLEFFAFLGKKMTFDVLDMGSDIGDQMGQLTLYYWYLSLPTILGIFLFWKLYPVKKKSIMYEKNISMIMTIPLGLVLIIATFIGIRGGVQLRSISPKEAYIFKHYELGNLAINATYTMIRSIGKEGIKKIEYFPSDKEAANYIYNNRSFIGLDDKVSKQNIMIIILESFSQEYVDEGYAPFFNSLAEKSLYFNENYANGRRSLEALPSILTGIPSIIGKPIYQSQYQSNKFFGLPRLLRDQGYSTHFFHGGKRGTMDFDSYTSSIGVDHYYALEDYPNQKHYDGHWGVYDHYYLEYVGNEIDEIAEPFMGTIFTLSSHQPYSIPSSVDEEFPSGKLEIHKSIGYVDYSLREFFNKIRLKNWFSNTLFIITADHTQKLETQKFNNTLGRYRVPLLFYHPKYDLSKYKKDKITQHVDILPSVLDFLDIKNLNPLLYGTSVFGEDTGRMLNFISGNYLYYKRPNLILFDGDKTETFLVNEQTSALESSNELEIEGILQELKAYIQLTNNGLKNNNLYEVQRNDMKH